MFLMAVTKSLNGKATINSFFDHLPRCLSKAEIMFRSGFPFANALVIIERVLEAG
jgi:hypothetical protein